MKNLLAKLLLQARTRDNLNTLVYMGSSLFSAFAGFVMIRYFTRYLGPEDFGIFGYVSSVNVFLIPFLCLNLNSYYLKEVFSRAEGQGRKTLLGTIVLFTLGWSLILTVVLMGVGSWLFAVLNIKFPFYPYMALTLLSNLFLGSTAFIQTQYRILSRVWAFFAICALQTVLTLGLGYYFVAFIPWGIYGRILGVFIGSTVLGVISLILLAPHASWKIDTSVLKDALAFSLPLIPYSLATLLYDMLDRFFLERYATTMAATGIYNIGSQYALIITMFAMSFYRAYEPTIFRLISEDRQADVNKSLIFLNNMLLLMAVPLIVISGPLITFLTRGKFVNSAEVASLLIIALYFRSAYTMQCTILLAISKTREMMWFSIVGLALAIGLSVTFVPQYLSVGTAGVKILLYFVMFLSSFVVLRGSTTYRPYMVHTVITGMGLLVLHLFMRSVSWTQWLPLLGR